MQQLTKVLLGIAVLCALVCAAGTANAQNVTTGTMVGIVMDAQKAVLPGATVVAVHTPTGTTYETVTQADGRFTFLSVRVGGPYKVTATMTGFKVQEQSAIEVGLGESRAVEFVLALQTVTESVTVVAEAQVIDMQRAGTATNVAAQTIESLPSISRSIQDYARTSPFVNVSQAATGNDTEINVGGRPNRYNNMQIDGAVNNDVFGLSTTGTPGGQTGTQPVSLDAIQEIQVLVSPYDVKQGGFSGGGVNAITKSGTNNFHGTAYDFFRNENFMGKIPQVPTFANSNPADSIVGTFSDKQYGFSIGGPIMKNKAFFFGNGDWARKLTPVGYSLDGASGQQFTAISQADLQAVLNIMKTTYGYNPGGLGEFSRPNNSDKYFGRFDFNLSSRHQLTARVNYVDAAAQIGSQSASSYNMPDHFYNMTDKMLSSVVQLNSVFGSTTFNEFRVTYSRERNIRGSMPGQQAFPEITFYPVVGSSSNSIRFGTEYSSMANRLNQDVYSLDDDLTLVKGSHTLTIGTHNEFYKFYNLFIQNWYGAYGFYGVANLQAGLAQQFYHYYSNTANPEEAANFRVRQFGFYFGDKWRAASNLTVTYGVRVDLPNFPDKPLANPVPLADFGYATDVVPAPTMWAPRAGFNYDLSQGSGKRAQIRGGLGMFAGRTPYVWMSNQYGNTGVQFTNLSTSLSTSNAIPFVADPFNQPTSVAGGSAGRQTINLVDPNYKYPLVMRTNIAYDKDLGFWGLVGSAELLYTKTLEDIYYKNLNLKATGYQPDGRIQYNGTGAQAAGTAWSYGQQTLRPDANLNNVILLTNSTMGYGWNWAFKVERPFKNGYNFSVAYLTGESYSTYDGTSSVANSNFTGTPVSFDANNVSLARSNYSPGNRITASMTIPIPMGKYARSSVSLFYTGMSGRPFDLRYGSDANGDSASANDLIYIPSLATGQVVFTNGTYDNFMGWLQRFDGALDYAGKIMPRNALRAPWSNQLDFRYNLTLFTPGKTRIEFTADMMNVLNLLNKNWGWQWWGPFPSSGGAVSYSIPVASSPLPTYSLTTITNQTANWYGNVLTRDDNRSRWQAQFGFRFRF